VLLRDRVRRLRLRRRLVTEGMHLAQWAADGTQGSSALRQQPWPWPLTLAARGPEKHLSTSCTLLTLWYSWT
jgi:hypothetical protein